MPAFWEYYDIIANGNELDRRAGFPKIETEYGNFIRKHKERHDMKTSVKTIMKICVTSIVTVMLTFALIGCGGAGDSGSSNNSNASNNSSNNNNNSSNSNNSNNNTTPNEITFGVPFEFDGLTITFGSEVTVKTLQNQFSSHDGATVAAVPVTVVNNSGNTHGLNMFYYSIYGPAGTKLDGVSAYFMEDDIDWAGDMRNGATLQTTMHILYVGPGDYYVEFSKPFDSKPIEVRLPLSL